MKTNQECWEVLEKFTGRLICQCGEEKDAFMMISIDPQNRVYKRKCILHDNVINVNFSKAKELPGQKGLPSSKLKLNSNNKIYLTNNQDSPLIFN